MVGPFADAEQHETAPFTIPPTSCVWAAASDGPVRMVDKDTGHCWRLPELAQAFTDATFVFMLRDPASAVASLVNGWLHPHWFFTYHVAEPLAVAGYSDAFEWGRHWWNFNMFPGWEDLREAPLPVVCAQQWAAAVRAMAADGEPLVADGRARFVSFDRLVAEPRTVLRGLAQWLDLDQAAVAEPRLEQVFMSMDPTARPVPADSPAIAAALAQVPDAVALAADLAG